MKHVDLHLDYSDHEFTLKIQNQSNESINIWSTNCSFGYYTIYFEVSFPKKKGAVCFLKRKLIRWTVNPVDIYTIPSNGYKELKFNLSDDTWNLSECLDIVSQKEIELKCVLEITPGELTLAHNILTGICQSNALHFDSISKVLENNS